MIRSSKALRPLLLLVLVACSQPTTQVVEEQKLVHYQPWESLEELFVDVQMAGIFEDSKTFVDSDPRKDPGEILSDYRALRDNSNFKLSTFIDQNFEVPSERGGGSFEVKEDLSSHLNDLWGHLTREGDTSNSISTLISLPSQYVVPGGRFREIYYWDSYFTMIGLGASGRLDLMESMIDNFAHLIETIGFIPNGNRTYYLGRSQPPYFSLMVNLLWQYTSDEKALKYLEPLQKEYDFWMKGSDKLVDSVIAVDRVVKYRGYTLNRYWDNFDTPRPESYREDVELAEELPEEEKGKLYRNLRAGAESGWDFSARWFTNKEDFSSIRTTEILPIDLNCLIYSMEVMLSRMYNLGGDTDLHRKYLKAAENRYNAINDVFWDEENGLYNDIIWTQNEMNTYVTAASFFPMYLKTARQDYADRQIPRLRKELLLDGGLSTTTMFSGQQWDQPNGWAPLQWVSSKGAEHYGHVEISAEIKNRWLLINKKVYRNTGKMMEKYNVSDTTLLAGGGEYPTQDGFGWTNGVYLGFVSEDAKY